MTDCDECRYKAQGSHNTICCMYYGAGETDPDGVSCEQFVPLETEEKIYPDYELPSAWHLSN